MVVYGPSRGHHKVGRSIPVVMEPSQVVAGDGGYRVLGPQHLAAQRVAGEQRLVKELKHDIVRIIGLEMEFLQDDLPLGLHVGGPQSRLTDDVGQ